MKHTFYKFRSNAFTLIELLVVLVVISILVAITVPVSKYASQRAKNAQFEVQMAKIKNALEDYRAKYGEYPITTNFETYTPSGNTIITNSDPQNMDDVWRHYPQVYTTLCHEVYERTKSDELYKSPDTYIIIDQNIQTNWPTVEIIEGVRVDYALTYPLILKPLANGEQPYLGDGEETLLTVVSLISKSMPRKDADLVFYSRKKDGSLRKSIGKRRYGWPINRHFIFDPRNGKQIKYTSDGLNYSITNW